MPAIGYVTREENGTYKGQLRTLSIQAEITITPNSRKAHDAQPDYRVLPGTWRSAPAGTTAPRPANATTSRSL
jgi:uncharacterized protein (DUF736 family)